MPVTFEVQNTANLGGTHSEHSSSNNRFGYFQPGVESLYVKDGAVRFVRFLPARDPSFSLNDPAWLSSYIPYRDKSHLDPDTKLPGYTSWYLMVRGYKFAGRTNGSFLSPATLRSLGITQGSDCPLADVRRFAKDNDTYKHLLEVKLGTGKKTKDLLPKLKFSPIINVLAFDERYQPEKVCVLELSGAALEDLQRKLCAPRPAGINPVTPAWDLFMLGDITDPMTGLVGRVKHGVLQGAGGAISTALVNFSDNEYFLQGAQAYPIDPNTEFGKQVLDKRYNLFSDKVLKIWSYQEIVDWMVEDNTIPYELVQEACSHLANIPPRPAQNPVHSNAPAGGAPAFGAPAFGAPAGGVAPAFGAPAGGAPAFGAPASGSPAFGGSAPKFGAPAGGAAQTFGAPAGGAPTFGAPAGGAPAFGTPAGGAPAFGAAPATPANTAVQTDDEDVPYDDGKQPLAGVSTPSLPPSMPPAMPTVQQAAPVAPEPKFWVVNGDKPVLQPRASVQDWINAGYAGPVMAENQQGGWKAATDFGFTVAVPTPPLAAPAAPAKPFGPTTAPAVHQPAAQQAPAVQQPAASTPATSAPVASALPAPAGPGLNDEEKARLAYLHALMTTGKVSPTELNEYVVLMSKQKAS